MRIALLLPSILTSEKYGKGRIFAPLPLATALAEGLQKRNHEVFIYGSKDIAKHTSVPIIAGDAALTDRELSYFQFRYREQEEQNYTRTEIIKRDFEYDLTLRCYQNAENNQHDVIHSYHDFGAHYFNELTKFPTIYTLHDPLPKLADTIEYHRFQKFTHHNYVSISNSQREGIVKLNFIDTVYHGIDVSQFSFSAEKGTYLVHFGRFLEDKGTDIAIDVAKKVGIPLHLATSTVKGNRAQNFYDSKVVPQIDNKQITLQGFLKGEKMAHYLAGALGFLMPIRWDEPFGMVMIEALAAGVPVIAYNRGSVSEIIKDGETGFVVDDGESDYPGKGSWVIKKTGVEGLCEAVRRLPEIDRAVCRASVEKKFSIEQMVAGYEKVYEKVVRGLV